MPQGTTTDPNMDPKIKIEANPETAISPEAAPEHAEPFVKQEGAVEHDHDIEKEAREKIGSMEEANHHQQISTHANDIKQLDEEKKIQKLLDLAKAKGVEYAINVAKKTEDAYLIDVLHDKLVQEGYYKK